MKKYRIIITRGFTRILLPQKYNFRTILYLVFPPVAGVLPDHFQCALQGDKLGGESPLRVHIRQPLAESKGGPLGAESGGRLRHSSGPGTRKLLGRSDVDELAGQSEIQRLTDTVLGWWG